MVAITSHPDPYPFQTFSFTKSEKTNESYGNVFDERTSNYCQGEQKSHICFKKVQIRIPANYYFLKIVV